MGEVRSKLLNSFMKYCAPIGWFSSPSHCYAGGIKAKMAWVFSDSQQPQLAANLVCTAYHILCKLEIQCLLCHSLGQMHREKKYRSETENVKRETIATQTKAITTRNQQHWSRLCECSWAWTLAWKGGKSWTSLAKLTRPTTALSQNPSPQRRQNKTRKITGEFY